MAFDRTGTEGRRLFIGGLPFSVDERDLEDLCEKYGKVEDGELNLVQKMASYFRNLLQT